jgi:demethylmenaquinone methyltransferase/2-methoxy-6-polyprenyl-1,4-benzoquinol methylase
MDDYKKYITDFFKEHAPYYDFISSPLLLIRGKAVEFSKAKPGSKVLDVCTGTGSQAFAFARHGCKVTGIDLSKEMLEIAIKKKKNEKITFTIGDATEIKYPPNSFDLSCIFFALHDMPQSARHKVLDEMKKVSNDILVVDYSFPKNSFLRFFYTLIPSLFESKFYLDFSKMDLNDFLKEHNLFITKKKYFWFGSVVMMLCKEKPKE